MPVRRSLALATRERVHLDTSSAMHSPPEHDGGQAREGRLFEPSMGAISVPQAQGKFFSLPLTIAAPVGLDALAPRQGRNERTSVYLMRIFW